MFQETRHHGDGGDSDSTGNRRKGDLDAPAHDGSATVGGGTGGPGAGPTTVEIRMPGATPTRDDDYFCTSFEVKKMTRGKRVYITGEKGGLWWGEGRRGPYSWLVSSFSVIHNI